MDRIGKPLFCAGDNPQMDIGTTAAQSIKVQVFRALKDFGSKWAPHNEAMFMAVLNLVGATTLTVVQGIDL